MFVRFDDTYINPAAVVSIEKGDMTTLISLSNGHMVSVMETPREVAERLIYSVNAKGGMTPETCLA